VDYNRKLQRCPANAGIHYSASHGLLMAGACVVHAWAQLTWARPADQAEVVVSECDCVAAGVDGMAGIVAADVVAGHDVEAPVHAHPDLPPSAGRVAMLVRCVRAGACTGRRNTPTGDGFKAMVPNYGARTAPH